MELSNNHSIMLEPGTLWTRTKEQTQHALSCGALQPIPTEYELVEQDGIHFLVRILSNLDRKQKAKKDQPKNSESSGKPFDPFLPYEEDLFVADFSPTHLCLLNKFNVVDHHLLIVTRAFEEQENLLTLPDFEAMWMVLAEIDGLGFYNGGSAAGASQRHKHLQWVPFPLVPDGLNIPIEPAIASAQFLGETGMCPQLPYVHAVIKFDAALLNSPSEAAATTLKHYHNLLKAIGVSGTKGWTGKQSAPYNLMITREWMMIVPRSQESYQNILVNSLGLCGAMLVRNSEEMQQLKDSKPLTILKYVGISR